LAAKALEETFVASLPFSLTADQRTVLQEIKRDLDAPVPMNRLLQGDVGSGKTLVAWISALHVIAGGQQVAFMAPTELLARQHAEHAAQLLEPLGVRIAFLTGSVKTKERKLLLEALAKGNIDILIRHQRRCFSRIRIEFQYGLAGIHSYYATNSDRSACAADRRCLNNGADPERRMLHMTDHSESTRHWR
jgi:transcription-repair coupling factor (superfamily II helicase)